MALDFTSYIRDDLHIRDDALAGELTTALDAAYRGMTATNPNALGEKAQSIKVRQAMLQLQHDLSSHFDTAGARLIYWVNIERDIDFRGGDQAFSVAPRLMFRVPAKMPGQTAPIKLSSLCPTVAPGVTPADVTDSTVLTYPNQEGGEDSIADRPVVQNCAVGEGDFVIIGKVGMAGRAAVWQTVADVMHTAPGEDAFATYDAHGTARDLADILTQLRALGFGNQYDTSDAYRKKLDGIAPSPDTQSRPDQVSGFYAKQADKTEATLRFVPGDTLLVGSGGAIESITGGGFALYEDSNGAERFAPLSRAYAKLSMLFKRSVDAVAPELQAAPLKFKPDHPLRDFGAPVAKFLDTVSQLNRKYSPAPSAALANRVPLLS